MSLLDQVRKLEHEVVDRLKALEPLIFEYDQLREVGERLGVDATGLYRVVKQLTDEGRVRKDGPRLHPAEPSAATASALESGANAPAAGASDGQPTESPATDPEPVTPPRA